MIISVNWLKQFTQIDASIDELATVIGARLVEIEGVESLTEKYKDVIVARVVECGPVEGSDHLNLTKIDDGYAVADVERDENGYVQVVCGAPNVREGLFVAWLPPTSTVPETFGDDEPFVLGARTLRGYMSNGMLASARELDLFDDHEGIIEVNKDVAPGTPFMAAYALDDQLLDIENKSLTHRPDTFGIVGFAREVAAIAGKGFQTPEWLQDIQIPQLPVAEAKSLSVAIDNPDLSSRYTAVVLTGINPDARTPLEIQTYLSRSGIRPISPTVDITNYLMLLTGQPLHAFDYDKVTAFADSTHIHVREGHVDETLALLDGRTITVMPNDIVIAAGDKAVALAGAMGGAATEVDSSTRTVILESATFNLFKLRETGMRHGIFTEALTRLTKGQPAALNAPVSAQAITLFGEITGAVPASQIVEDYPVRAEQPTLLIPLAKINNLLGTRFSVNDVVETLGNVEFMTSVDGETVSATPPYWRTDIHIDEDVIEEVGRLNGFDLVEPRLPRRDFTAVYAGPDQRLRARVRETLSSAGANELLTYSFVHGELLKKAGQQSDNAYQLQNALSPDLQYYRLSLTPSLLDKVNMNVRQKFDEFAMYEMGKTHQKDSVVDDGSNLPNEQSRLAFTYVASEKRASGRGSAYYQARAYLDRLLRVLNVSTIELKPLADEPDQATTVFEPKRSAAVYARVGDETRYVGVIGEYKASVRQSFKLPDYAAGFEVDLDQMAGLWRPVGSYVPLSRFPGSDADITFALPADVTYEQFGQALNEALDAEPLQTSVIPGDIYRPAGESARNVTVRISVVSYDRTLTREEVNAVIGRVCEHVNQAIAGNVRDTE